MTVYGDDYESEGIMILDDKLHVLICFVVVLGVQN